MNGRKEIFAIFMVFLLGVSLRMYFSLQGAGLIGADGFFHSNLVSEILRTGSFPPEDAFSWGGRPVNYFPGFHLLLSALLLSTGIPKGLLFLSGPLFFAVSFLAVLVISRRQGIGTFPVCAVFATIPLLVWKTATNLLPDSAIFFLLLISIFITRTSEGPLSLLILLGGGIIHPIFFIAYLPLFFESRARTRSKVFLLLASLMLSLALLAAAGIRISSGIRQNVPSAMQAEIFEGADPAKIIYRLGPAVAPMAMLFPENAAYFAAPLLPAALGVLELDRALLLSSLFLIFTAGKFISRRKQFTQVLVVAILFFWASYTLRALSWAPVQKGDFNSLSWISQNTAPYATILTLPGDGYLVAYVAGRKNTIDGRFAGMTDSEERFALVESAIANPRKYADQLGARTLVLTSRTFSSKGPSKAADWDLICESGPGGVYRYAG